MNAAVSAVLLGADASLLARIGRSLRQRESPTHVARDAADARALARRHPGVLVLGVVGEPDGAAALAVGLRSRRGGCEVVHLQADDPPATVVAALDQAVGRAETRRHQRRLEVLLKRRTRQLAARHERTEAVADRRLRRLAVANLHLRERVDGLGKLLALVTECGEAEMPGHCDQVSSMSLALGVRCGLAGEAIEHLRLAALLHDIGRMGAPGGDESEDGHAERGARLLEGLSLPVATVEAVRHHHERHDGSGLPGHVTGEDIPLMARIIAVADFHARLVHGEPGSLPLCQSEALEFLRLAAGRSLDPALVAMVEEIAGDRAPVETGELVEVP